MRRLSVVRFLSWHRRELATVSAAVAILALCLTLRPSAPPGSVALVATRAVPAGASLTAEDVELRQIPFAALPDRAVTDPTVVIGRTAAAGLTTGTILTEATVVAPRGPTRSGWLTAPVRVRDPDVLALLRPGDRVDLLIPDTSTSGAGSAGGGEGIVIARAALVVAIPRGQDTSGAFSESRADLVLVEVDERQAARLTAAAARGEVTLMLR